MNHEQRIELTDTVTAAMVKLAEGNPGAAVAMIAMVTASPRIDPYASFGGFFPLMSLDVLGLYGPHIHVLWKDVCEENPLHALTLLRAGQLGIVSHTDIVNAASERRHGPQFNFAELLRQVQAQLPDFAANEPAAGRTPAPLNGENHACSK